MKINTTLHVVDLDDRVPVWPETRAKARRLLVFCILDALVIAAIVAIYFWS